MTTQVDGKPANRNLGEHTLYLFRVLHDFTTDEGHIVKVGDEGKSFAQGPNGWVRVTVPRYPYPIIFPKDRIQVGSRRMSATSWILKRRQNIMATPDITPAASGGLLYRTAFEFFTAIQANAASPANVKQSILSFMGTTDAEAARMATMIVSGCQNAGTRAVFASGSLTLDSICNAGQLIVSARDDSTREVSKAPGFAACAAIYAIRHGEFEDQARKDAFYIGGNVDASACMDSHNEDCMDKTSQHYLTWRASNKYRMVNVCCAPAGDASKTERCATQMFLVAALDAYAPNLVDDFAKFLDSDQSEEGDDILQGAMQESAFDRSVPS